MRTTSRAALAALLAICTAVGAPVAQANMITAIEFNFFTQNGLFSDSPDFSATLFVSEVAGRSMGRGSNPSRPSGGFSAQSQSDLIVSLTKLWMTIFAGSTQVVAELNQHCGITNVDAQLRTLCRPSPAGGCEQAL